jgi:hypothetical protein
LYVAVGSVFDIGEDENWKIFSQVRFDLSDSIQASNQVSSAKADLDGFSVNLGIGFQW